MDTADAGTPPLNGLRVVDSADERGEACGRLLADLGADVVLIEPPGGGSARRRRPLTGDRSISFAVRNANKRGMQLDPTRSADRERLGHLLARADVWIESGAPGSLASVGLDPSETIERHRHLVVVSVTPFGQTGPYRDFVATDMVLFALGGMMYRAGVPGKPPLVAPGAFAYDVGGITAGLATLLALRERDRSGRGQHVDVSIMDAVANLADWALPNFSASGRVAGRQGSGLVYPVFPCADGFVRMVLPLSPPQWRALRTWLRDPEELQGAEWEQIAYRLGHLDRIVPYIVELLAELPMDRAASEGQERELAVTPVYRPGGVMTNEHVTSRDTFTEAEIAPGLRTTIATGYFLLDGARLGFRHRAPEPGEHDGAFTDWGEARVGGDGTDPEPPLTGVRVLDFGIGAVGVEAGRLLAEYGADVIKVESRTYPDFIRTVAGTDMNPNFASSNRSKRSFGVNAKTEAGREVLLRLAEAADIVVENSATGVMDRLGIGYGALRASNPDLVMVSSQLLGSRGAWASWSGYGPNTRPFAGLTWLWNHAEDAEHPAGVSTIHPDHLAGRLCAVVALAVLRRRERGGGAGHAEVAQFESVIGMLADLLALEALEPRSVVPRGNHDPAAAPWGAYPCVGDDEWCVMNVRDDRDWAALQEVMGSPGWAAAPELALAAGRVERRDEIDEKVSSWTRELEPREVMDRLQAVGVPAGIVVNPRHQVDDPHLQARGFLRPVEQSPLGRLVLEGPAFRGTRMAGPDVRAAPGHGEHTREVARELLGLDDAAIDTLVAEGVLEVPD